MSSFEWMELQSLTNDIELSRSRLAEARGRGDRGRVRALEEEITRAEKTRLQLLTHISTNIASAPDGAAAAKAKEAAGSGQAASALVAEVLQVAEALQDEAAGDQLADDPEPAPRKGRESAAARRASARASADEASADQTLDDAVSAAESAPLPEAGDDADLDQASAPVAEALPNEAGGKEPLADRVDPIVAGSAASPASAPTADRKGGSTVWDQLTPSDLERAKNELGTRRAEILARHAEELKGLDAEQNQLETLEQAIESFLQKMKGLSAGSTVVELRQQGNG